MDYKNYCMNYMRHLNYGIFLNNKTNIKILKTLFDNDRNKINSSIRNLSRTLPRKRATEFNFQYVFHSLKGDSCSPKWVGLYCCARLTNATSNEEDPKLMDDSK